MKTYNTHRINCGMFAVVVFLLLSFAISQDAYGQRRRQTRRPRTAVNHRKTQRDTIPSVATVINNIEGLYDAVPFTEVWSKAYNQLQDTISRYFNLLPEQFNRKEVTTHYYNSIVDASKQEGQELALLQNGIIYIALGDPAEMETAYKAVAMYYAYANDKQNLENILYYFDKYSRFHDNVFQKTVEALNKEYDTILHPVPFPEEVKGTWVMVNHTGDMGFPYSIIDINSLYRPRGGIYMRNFPGQDNLATDTKINQMRSSQLIGGNDNGYITASFSSDHLRRGSDTFANMGFETTRQIRANVAGEIAASDASFGDKLGATVVTGVVTGLLDGLFSSTAQSYKRVAVTNLQLNRVSPNVLQGAMQYLDDEVNVNQMYRTPKTKYNGPAEYVRWEPSDGVYFVNSSNKIFSVTPQNQLDLTEYYEIKKKYSWTRPKYLLPFIGGELAGAGLVAWGISDFIAGGKYHKRGNNKQEKRAYIRGGILFGIGFIAIESFALYTFVNIRGKKDCEELNRKNLQKLKDKARATVSIAPIVDLDSNIGLYAGINF